jgi:hypothetical protein
MSHKAENRLAYYKSYYRKNAGKYRFRSLLKRDRSKGVLNTISYEEYDVICKQSCYYCEEAPSNGVDAFDNSLGHTTSNCVPCCERCNYILGDVPREAKIALKDGLLCIGKLKLMDNWTLPTKRNRNV